MSPSRIRTLTLSMVPHHEIRRTAFVRYITLFYVYLAILFSESTTSTVVYRRSDYRTFICRVWYIRVTLYHVDRRISLRLSIYSHGK